MNLLPRQIRRGLVYDAPSLVYTRHRDTELNFSHSNANCTRLWVDRQLLRPPGFQQKCNPHRHLVFSTTSYVLSQIAKGIQKTYIYINSWEFPAMMATEQHYAFTNRATLRIHDADRSLLIK